MRRLVPLLLITALALPAMAQQQAPEKTAEPEAKAKITAPPRALPPARTADQCRATCAQELYFCLADSDAETCNPNWSVCRVGCNKL